jgi:ubiquinone/menaquinone biosynthesis C-methylase UbiE
MSFKNDLITAVSFLKKPWKRKLITISKSFRNKNGIEVGGPSPRTFGLRNIFPVYLYAKSIDGVNFSNNTIWEGQINAGNNYNYFEQKKGYQYITDATDLSMVESNKYDFVLSSHSLEHIANPIKALNEWNRVLKSGGRLVLILPDKQNTFDKNRCYTTFEHLVNDFNANTQETDLTHVDEIFNLHNFEYDKITDHVTFKEKLNKNFETRIAHHHVFSLEVITEMLKFTGFETTYQQVCPPFHLVTIASKK